MPHWGCAGWEGGCSRFFPWGGVLDRPCAATHPLPGVGRLPLCRFACGPLFPPRRSVGLAGRGCAWLGRVPTGLALFIFGVRRGASLTVCALFSNPRSPCAPLGLVAGWPSLWWVGSSARRGRSVALAQTRAPPAIFSRSRSCSNHLTPYHVCHELCMFVQQADV